MNPKEKIQVEENCEIKNFCAMKLQTIPQEISENLRKIDYPFNLNKEGWIMKPYQEEVIKWFRDSKEMFITIIPQRESILSVDFTFECYIEYNGGAERVGEYELYERAQLEAIKKAIQKIEQL
jgi:aspartyl/asparaginyl-tRNA synthetase